MKETMQTVKAIDKVATDDRVAADPDLVAAAASQLASVPRGNLTVRGAVARVRQMYGSKPFLRNLGPHLALLEQVMGDTPLKDVEVVDLEILRRSVIGAAQGRRGSKHGKGAGEHFTEAARAIFRVSGTAPSSNPALQLPSLKRPDSSRSALSPDDVQALFACVLGVTDPLLATLIGLFSIQSGARLMGVVGLTVRSLLDAPYVVLVEKNSSRRRVPITDALRRALLRFAVERGATQPRDAVFRSTHHRSVSDAYVGDLMRQWRTACHASGYWALHEDFSHHWFRHTAVNNYAQLAGLAAASHFAGHRITRMFGVTGTYTHVPDAQQIPVCEQLHGPTRDSGQGWARQIVHQVNGRLALISHAETPAPGEMRPAGLRGPYMRV